MSVYFNNNLKTQDQELPGMMAEEDLRLTLSHGNNYITPT